MLLTNSDRPFFLCSHGYSQSFTYSKESHCKEIFVLKLNLPGVSHGILGRTVIPVLSALSSNSVSQEIPILEEPKAITSCIMTLSVSTVLIISEALANVS